MNDDKNSGANKIVGSSDVLTRCPFCGKEPKPPYYRGGYYHAGCVDCDIIMARQELWSLIAAWNMRANTKLCRERLDYP